MFGSNKKFYQKKKYKKMFCKKNGTNKCWDKKNAFGPKCLLHKNF